MDENDIIEVSPKDIEIIDNKDYKTNISDLFTNLPKVAKCLIKSSKASLKKIEQLLYVTPDFINLIKSTLPETSYQSILSNEQKQKIAEGSIKLMTKKDGSLMANLVDAKTKKIVDTISLDEIKVTPELYQAINNFSTQMQLAQIAEQIQFIQLAVEEVRQGQEYDRLATAYSCQQKLLQALEIKNDELRAKALLSLAFDSENSRNLLMQSQNLHLAYIKKQPESIIGKILSGANSDTISQKINEIRENLNAVNMVSLVEAMAYEELGETSASKLSLQYYADYINTTYLHDEKFVERLDLMDPSPVNYWSTNLPNIKSKIEKLSHEKQLLLDEKENKNGTKKEV